MARLAALALASTFVVACSSSSSTTDETPAPTPPADTTVDLDAPFTIEVSSGALRPTFSEDVFDYELDSYSTLDDVTLSIAGAGRTAHVLGNTVSASSITLPKMAITDDAIITIDVDATTTHPAATYRIKLRPHDMPTWQVTTDNPEAGYVMLGTFDFLQNYDTPSFLLVVDTMGALASYKRLPDKTLPADYKRQVTADGTVYTTYISDGFAHVLDAHMKPIRDYSVLPTPKHQQFAADIHECIVLGPDHVIIESYIPQVVTNVPTSLPQRAGGANVAASVIQEIENGQVVFDWQSTDHPELYALSSDLNDYTSESTQDYAHLNSIVINPTTNDLVVSFRHLDAVLGISRTDGSITWRLGGVDDSFATPAEQRPSHQHFASILSDGRLMLYDNGVASSASRVSTYGLDFTNHQLTSFETLPLNAYSAFMGSAQPVATNSLLVGLGADQPGEPDVILFDRTTNKRTFTLTLGVENYYSYRAQWLP